VKKFTVLCLLLQSSTTWGLGLYPTEAAPRRTSISQKFPEIIRVIDSGDQKKLFGRDFIGAEATDVFSQETFKDLINDAIKNNIPLVVARSVGVGEDTEQVHYRYYPVIEAHDFIFGSHEGVHFGDRSAWLVGIRFSRYKQSDSESNLFDPIRFEDDLRGYMIAPLRYYATFDGKRFVYFGSERDISEASASDSEQMKNRDNLVLIMTKLRAFNELSETDSQFLETMLDVNKALAQQYERIGQSQEASHYLKRAKELEERIIKNSKNIALTPSGEAAYITDVDDINIINLLEDYAQEKKKKADDQRVWSPAYAMN
jgi:hypothetical protein